MAQLIRASCATKQSKRTMVGKVAIKLDAHAAGYIKEACLEYSAAAAEAARNYNDLRLFAIASASVELAAKFVKLTMTMQLEARNKAKVQVSCSDASIINIALGHVYGSGLMPPEVYEVYSAIDKFIANEKQRYSSRVNQLVTE